MRHTRITLALMAAAAVMAVLALVGGCNTVEGVGRDIESAGEAIEDAAN